MVSALAKNDDIAVAGPVLKQARPAQITPEGDWRIWMILAGRGWGKTKTGAGGTGLGLAICHEIIAAHRGRIWAENRPEGGTTFSFEIPLSLNTSAEKPQLLAGVESSLAMQQ